MSIPFYLSGFQILILSKILTSRTQTFIENIANTSIDYSLLSNQGRNLRLQGALQFLPWNFSKIKGIMAIFAFLKGIKAITINDLKMCSLVSYAQWRFVCSIIWSFAQHIGLPTTLCTPAKEESSTYSQHACIFWNTFI